MNLRYSSISSAHGDKYNLSERGFWFQMKYKLWLVGSELNVQLIFVWFEIQLPVNSLVKNISPGSLPFNCKSGSIFAHNSFWPELSETQPRQEISLSGLKHCLIRQVSTLRATLSSWWEGINTGCLIWFRAWRNCWLRLHLARWVVIRHEKNNDNSKPGLENLQGSGLFKYNEVQMDL